jgi:hypothetical protein
VPAKRKTIAEKKKTTSGKAAAKRGKAKKTTAPVKKKTAGSPKIKPPKSFARRMRTSTRPQSVTGKSRITAKREPTQKSIPSSSVPSHLQNRSAGPKYFFSTDIPDHYNETYMRALPRDPLWIFSYWEISQSSMDNVKTALGDDFDRARWVLRVSDVTEIEYDGTNAWRSMDIDVTFNANNWYIKVWEPGRVYCIQGGLLTQQGIFVEAVRSNAIRMPRAGVSAITDEEWSTAASDELLKMSAASLKRSIGASERLEETEIGAGFESGIGRGSGSGAIL